MTRIITLEYHDVVDAGEFSASGFTEPGADSYKLTTATSTRISPRSLLPASLRT